MSAVPVYTVTVEQTPSAGWYPDPSTLGALRYWDGAAWTEHQQQAAAQQPVPPAVPQYGQYAQQSQQYGQQPQQYPPATSIAPMVLRAPEGTDWKTVWIWVIVLLPVVQLLALLFIPWGTMYSDMFAGILDDPGLASTAFLYPYTEPWFWILMLLSWAMYAFLVYVAYRDYRELEARGVPRPFHWAWQFLGTVYPIGRSVVVNRRTGRGLAPIWAVVGSIVLSFIVTGIITSLVVSDMFSVLDQLSSYSYDS